MIGMTVCSGIFAPEVAAPLIFDRIRMVEQINGQGQQEESTAAEAGTGNRTAT